MATLDDIRRLLKSRGWDREELGRRVGVKKRTVDNWLAGSYEIPAPKMQLIDALLTGDGARVNITPSIDLSCVESVSFVLTSQEADRLRRALEATNMSMQDYLRQAVNERTAQILAEQETSKDVSSRPNVASAC